MRMAVLVSKVMNPLQEGQEKTVHPFFQKPLKPIQAQSIQIQNEPETEKAPKRGQRKSVRNVKSSISENDPTQHNGASHSSEITNGEQADLLEVDPNNGRRKRRKTTSPEAETTTEVEIDGPSTATTTTTPTKASKQLRTSKRKQATITKSKEAEVPTKEAFSSNGLSFNIKVSSPPENVSVKEPASEVKAFEEAKSSLESSADDSTKRTIDDTLRPKKVLQFNPKTGTIGSPPKKNIPPKKKGGAKKSTVDEEPNSRIIVIGYGGGQTPASEVGAKIEDILKGIKISTSSTKTILTDVKNIKEVTSRKGNGVDVVPWWKTAKKKAPVQEVQEPSKAQQAEQGKSSLGRPSSPSKILSTFGRPRSNEVNQAPPRFGGFGAAPKTPKFPGAIEPAWPWSGIVHVRGERERDEEDVNTPSTSSLDGESRSGKKGAKYQAVEIVKNEDIINTFTAELRIEETFNNIQDLHIDDFAPLSPCLRIPSKHIESGPNLQRRVRRELVSKLQPVAYEESSDDEIQERDIKLSNVHPALTNIYNSIATSLSAFDKAECENQSWAQKYAPNSAEEVLQTGPEAFILKEWLQKLTVMSVESGSADNKVTKKSTSSKGELPGKRKRKSKKLDGFVVSSGEEDNEMDEITEPEDGDLLGGSGLVKKTVVRSCDLIAKGSKDSKRLANAVVMSGPHGCGKSATVFAVAKELGFEVFEINPNSKRSGKEVMDKVGDMTRNHLVQRSKVNKIHTNANEDEERLSNAVAEDLKSGRQGIMNSFFTSKVPMKPKPVDKDVESSAAQPDISKGTIAPKGSTKQQKQSLILLEEIDVLYEEDRGFWQTVMLLIAQSKRPIIMTCNDEAAVPIAALSLHAIIRFNAVPTDLAVDYMLLVAANEGHVIRREAVKALYESRASDLRGSLTELEFWCQFAVGDRKAGMEWFYPRLPLGCDLDEHGDKYRVVSEDTYHTGMGWLSQDALESQRPYIDIEEETLHESWNGWGIDVGDWQRNLDISTWAKKIKDSVNDRATERAALIMYDDFTEAMSAADCFSHFRFGADNQVIIDASHPELSNKAREDYTLANQLLDVSPQAIYDETSINISLWMKSRAREVLQIRQHVEHGWEIHRELDGATEKQVQNLIRSQSCPDSNAITRRDLSLAFDPISEAEKTYVWSTGNLEASCFDRTMNLIILDVAPYVRSIVSYDAHLQKDRSRLSNLLSQGGSTKAPKTKRMRTTRAAMSALEGGARSTTRKEKYFSQDINPYLVLRTGSQSWLDAVTSLTAGTDQGSRRSSMQMSDGNMDIESGRDELID